MGRRLAAGAGSFLVALVVAVFAGTWTAGAFGLPFRVDTRSSLSSQFGYAPRYQVNLPTFDPLGRPFIRSRGRSQDVTGSVRVHTGKRWVARDFLAAVRAEYPSFAATVNGGGYVSEAVEFDALGRAYTLLQIRLRDGHMRNLLLWSTDAARTWHVLTLPFGDRSVFFDGRDIGNMTMEHFSGWNVSHHPPLVAVWDPVEDWPGNRASRNELYVIQPRFVDGVLSLPAPRLVSDRFLGPVLSVGGASFATRVDDRSFIVWTEVADDPTAGSPTSVAEYDPDSDSLSAPVVVAMAHPGNDDHTTPGICRDSRGYLHVLTGGHYSAFQYTRSTQPADISSWTEPAPVLTSGFVTPDTDKDGRASQTYLSLVCDTDDSLVIAFRQRRAGVDAAFRGATYDALCVQRRPADGEWGRALRVVRRRNQPGYVQYYHKLAVDRRGRLFLTLSLCIPRDYPVERRRGLRYPYSMMLTSKDGADWRFATTNLLTGGARTAAD